MSATDYIQQYPRITVRSLRRSGLFSQPSPDLIVIRSESQDFVCTFNVKRGAITVLWDDASGPQVQGVNVYYDNLPFGQRVALVCPRSGGVCNELVLKDGSLASAQHHGLRDARRSRSTAIRNRANAQSLVHQIRGLDGYAPARGRRREGLIARLKAIPLFAGYCPEAEELIAEEDARLIRLERQPERSSRKRDRYPPRQLSRLGGTWF
jgi:hypothetical protein